MFLVQIQILLNQQILKKQGFLKLMNLIVIIQNIIKWKNHEIQFLTEKY